eukprot:CAMPEP_0183347138 /NCGR_PEP_ID=MMETSP0164_2-20130417/12053_1 /TAXON_ID=221442 /ORGANISM="Coccolithus pelagicus ssp braarudi, Strain PLY182g" /LENGTH=167 /DNA_ID=CAMNT_0025518523 /DNA_START=239 /DNA_END=743 /DNA_ORIENTATION=+
MQLAASANAELKRSVNLGDLAYSGLADGALVLGVPALGADAGVWVEWALMSTERSQRLQYSMLSSRKEARLLRADEVHGDGWEGAQALCSFSVIVLADGPPPLAPGRLGVCFNWFAAGCSSRSISLALFPLLATLAASHMVWSSLTAMPMREWAGAFTSWQEVAWGT